MVWLSCCGLSVCSLGWFKSLLVGSAVVQVGVSAGWTWAAPARFGLHCQQCGAVGTVDRVEDVFEIGVECCHHLHHHLHYHGIIHHFILSSCLSGLWTGKLLPGHWPLATVLRGSQGSQGSQHGLLLITTHSTRATCHLLT